MPDGTIAIESYPVFRAQTYARRARDGHAGDVLDASKDFSDRRILALANKIFGFKHQNATDARKAVTVYLRDLAEEQKRSLIDGLTGVFNKAHFDTRFAQAHKQARAVGHSREKRTNKGTKGAALLTFDANDFSEINNTYGHAAGDYALRKIVERLRKHIRETDEIFRLGGDEFAVILYDVHPGFAEEKALDIKQALDSFKIRHNRKLITVSVSVGWSFIHSDMSARNIYDRADFNMYGAKRNRNVVANDP